VLIYTASQYFSWQLYPKNKTLKYKRFYYIGLLAICLPVFLYDKENAVFWVILIKTCCWLLVVSVLAEIIWIIKINK